MNFKNVPQAVWIIALALLFLWARLAWDFGSVKIQVAFADEQTEIFEQMRSQAMTNTVEEAAGCLRYIEWYYPSGSKQVSGSRLDRIVERARTHAMNDIIGYLRTKTGEDLGNQPAPWIEKYARK